MARIFGCIIGIYIFGVIYGEILNSLTFFHIKVNVYLFAGSMSLTFIIFDVFFSYFEKRVSESNHGEVRLKNIKDYYYKLLAFLGLVLLIAVPFVWWGAIKRLAIQVK